MNTKEWIKLARSIHGDNYDYSFVEYVDSKTKVLLKCNHCGKFFMQNPTNHINGQRCPNKCRTSLYWDEKSFIELARALHDDKFIYDFVNYVNARTKVLLKCKACGYEFEVTPDNHISECGCPICNESQGERKIRVWLEKHNLIKGVDFIPQFRDKWLNKQSLDFFFPKLKIAIEYDGIQHFKPDANWGDKKEYSKIQERDTRKNRLCEENGIKLIRIPYTEFDNVENILEGLYNDD